MWTASERFVVERQGLRYLTWEEAEALPVRVKTSLVLTRARTRRALLLFGHREPVPDAYALGYLFSA